MAGVTEPKLPPWVLKLGLRRAGLLVLAVFVVLGAGLLVAAIFNAHGAWAFLALGLSVAVGGAAVPLLGRVRQRRGGGAPSWLFWAILGAVALSSLLPEPALVSLLALGAGFFLTSAPVYRAHQRAHWTEIEARWASWQG